MKEINNQAILIADLGFGDSGKGTITDFLTRHFNAHTIIRYNGGPQAAHNILSPEGKYHTFAQFGSGMLMEGVRTHLSRFMLVDPLAMLKEERHLQNLGVSDAFARTTIDRGAVIVTPFHQAVNRLKEITPEGDSRHQSCGMGVKEAVADYNQFGQHVLFAKDLEDTTISNGKLKFIWELQLDKVKDIRSNLPRTEVVEHELRVLDNQYNIGYSLDIYQRFSSLVKIVDSDYFSKILNQPGTAIFEGAQGVLLDVNFGFSPFTTWTNITFNNADTLLSEQNFQGPKTKIGVVRAYAHRHGAGPFVTEDLKLSLTLPDPHNKFNPWQGQFRVGYFDLLTSAYALAVLGNIDSLALTHLDRFDKIPEWKVCQSYQYQGTENPDDFFDIQHRSVKKIKVNKPAASSYQRQLTQLLYECRPEYQFPVNQGDRSAYLEFLESQLKVPVSIISSGPTFLDKQLLLKREFNL